MTQYRGLLYTWEECLERWGVEHHEPKAKELLAMIEGYVDDQWMDSRQQTMHVVRFVDEVLLALFKWIDARNRLVPDERFERDVRKLLKDHFPEERNSTPEGWSARREDILRHSFAAICGYLEGYP